MDSISINETYSDNHSSGSSVGRMAVIIWVLVFWLESPMNYTEYTQYSTERDCRDSAVLWQRRFNMVNSRLVAECRDRTVEGKEQ